MKVLMTKLWFMTIKETRKILDIISSLMGYFLLSVAIGAGLTFGFYRFCHLRELNDEKI